MEELDLGFSAPRIEPGLSVEPRLYIYVMRWPVRLGKHGIQKQSALLVLILTYWAIVQCVLARENICATLLHHRGAPRLNAWAPSLCHVYHWVQSSTHVACLITAMHMIPSSIRPFLLVTPQCQHNCLTLFLTHLHG